MLIDHTHTSLTIITQLNNQTERYHQRNTQYDRECTSQGARIQAQQQCSNGKITICPATAMEYSIKNRAQDSNGIQH